MKILLVDDNEAKSSALVSEIESALANDRQRSVTVAKTLSNAVRLASVFIFDLIILDLMLPYVEGGAPSSQAGLELLRQLRAADNPNVATTVIGLSAFPEEIAFSRSTFESLGVLVTQFNEDSAWRQSLRSVLERVSTRASSKPIDVDFLILCALEEERAGFDHAGFEKVSEVIVAGLNVHYTRIAGSPERLGCIIRLSQMGLVSATFETGVALNAFSAEVLCMSGICAGFSRQTKLGQLVVASPAWEYQAGKWSKNGFEIAPMQIPLRPATRAAIDQIINRSGFIQDIESGVDITVTRPSNHCKPMLAPFASGSAVIADSRRLEHIQEQHRKVAALDMETFGVYFAAYESSSAARHYFSVKCVVDFADTKKDDDLHPYGCVIAARATEQITRGLLMQADALADRKPSVESRR